MIQSSTKSYKILRTERIASLKILTKTLRLIWENLDWRKHQQNRTRFIIYLKMIMNPLIDCMEYRLEQDQSQESWIATFSMRSNGIASPNLLESIWQVVKFLAKPRINIYKNSLCSQAHRKLLTKNRRSKQWTLLWSETRESRVNKCGMTHSEIVQIPLAEKREDHSVCQLTPKKRYLWWCLSKHTLMTKIRYNC